MGLELRCGSGLAVRMRSTLQVCVELLAGPRVWMVGLSNL